MISTIWLVNRILATVIISFLPHFLGLAIFCRLNLIQDLFMDYLLCVSSDECVTGHNEMITHDNIHSNFVWFSRVCGQAFKLNSEKLN